MRDELGMMGNHKRQSTIWLGMMGTNKRQVQFGDGSVQNR